ncbi:hypothetical protein D3C72_1068810 [compost metagenome]
MAIRSQRQTKVAAVFRIVNRLLHRTQQHGLQHFMVRTFGHFIHQCGVVLRLRLVATAQRQAQLAQHAAQCTDVIVTWAIVHAEQRRFVIFLDKACSGDVRHNHALFDQFVSVVTHRRFDALNTTFGVKDKLGFFGFESDTATFSTRLIQHLVHRMQFFQVFDQWVIMLTQLLIALQNMPDLVIR